VATPGDVFLCHGTDVSGCVVQWATRSFYGHCSLVVADDRVVEATSRGVLLTDLRAYATRTDLIVRVADSGLSDAQRAAAVSLAYAAIGAPYDWREVACVGLSLLSAGRIALTAGMSGAFTCSELVAEALWAGGVALPKAPSAMTPKDIALLCGVEG